MDGCRDFFEIFSNGYKWRRGRDRVERENIWPLRWVLHIRYSIFIISSLCSQTTISSYWANVFGVFVSSSDDRDDPRAYGLSSHRLRTGWSKPMPYGEAHAVWRTHLWRRARTLYSIFREVIMSKWKTYISHTSKYIPVYIYISYSVGVQEWRTQSECTTHSSSSWTR